MADRELERLRLLGEAIKEIRAEERRKTLAEAVAMLREEADHDQNADMRLGINYAAQVLFALVEESEGNDAQVQKETRSH